MTLAEQQSISLSNCSHSWEEVDSRAEQLGLSRSKYTQMLYEIELKHKLLSDYKKLDSIGKKYDVRRIDIIILILLLGILSFFLSYLWIFRGF